MVPTRTRATSSSLLRKYPPPSSSEYPNCSHPNSQTIAKLAQPAGSCRVGAKTLFGSYREAGAPGERDSWKLCAVDASRVCSCAGKMSEVRSGQPLPELWKLFLSVVALVCSPRGKEDEQRRWRVRTVVGKRPAPWLVLCARGRAE